jgi:hypothetical protein
MCEGRHDTGGTVDGLDGFVARAGQQIEYDPDCQECPRR